MNTLTKSNKMIVKKIRERMELFESFEQVYLFGSVLNFSTTYNDIDILIIYKEYSSEIGEQFKIIAEELGKACGSFIDLTALSVEEEKDVVFLKKLKSHYLQMK